MGALSFPLSVQHVLLINCKYFGGVNTLFPLLCGTLQDFINILFNPLMVCLDLPHLLQLLSQPLVFLELPVFLMFLSLSITTFITTHCLCLFSTTMFGWLATASLSVWLWRSNRILAWSFSTTPGGVSHFVSELLCTAYTRGLVCRPQPLWIFQWFSPYRGLSVHVCFYCCSSFFSGF